MEESQQPQRTLITILIPVFNKCNRLKICLNSLERQTNKNFKVVISDNCSTDSSIAIIDEFLKTTSIKSEYYWQSENIGATRNFEFLLGKIDTDYFFFFDAEDELSENYIEQVYLEVLSTSERIDVLVPQFTELGTNKQQRLLLAPTLLNIPYEARLPFLLSMTNLAGVAYLWYAVYRTQSSKSLFHKLLEFVVINPTKHQSEDIALSWAVVATLRNMKVNLSMQLLHFSRLVVDDRRQFLNHKAIEMIYAQTQPEILREAISVFDEIFSGPKCISQAAKAVVDSNIELTRCRDNIRSMLAPQK
jgi:glycosyltransferase involved in cell wall biosynthesis